MRRMARGLRSFIRRKTALAAAAILFLIALIIVFAGLISRYDPLEQNIALRLSPPSSSHIFGTDGFGRDVLSRVLHGGQVTLYVALFSVTVAVLIGIPLGAYAAYSGGRQDLIIGRIVDAFLGFPFIILAVIIVVALESSPTSVAVAIAAVLAPRITVLTRTSALLVIQEPYIHAAKATGAGNGRIVFLHVLPNCVGPPLSQAVGYIGTAIATESTLSYLGLGVPPPYPSWGRMIQEGTTLFFDSAPWLVAFPGMALLLLVVCFSLLSDFMQKS